MGQDQRVLLLALEVHDEIFEIVEFFAGNFFEIFAFEVETLNEAYNGKLAKVFINRSGNDG